MITATRPPRRPDRSAAVTGIDRRQRTPLHRQIYERYRRAIEQGLLRPGERVASARDLAAELGVARGTVEAAYGQLAGEGYLQPRGQAGTVVAPHLPAVKPGHKPAGPRAATPSAPPGAAASSALHGVTQADSPITSHPAAPPRTAGLLVRSQVLHPTGPQPQGAAPPAHPLPFQLGIPALDAFPRKLWSRLAARAVRATTPADLHYGNPAGHAPLRTAIAKYLLVSRGVACAPHQVFITAGHRNSLALIARLLLKPGADVWSEDPGYPAANEVLQACGARLAHIPVDGDGIDVAHGLRSAPAARLALVTPSHQAPLGVSLSLARRLQLLQWAARAKAWIVEDDYDGEYRYTGPPLPALKSLDTRDRVIYAGSFSKVLFPGLALAYLVVPEGLAARFDAACRAASNGPPQLTQAIVAAFIDGGHFARHLKKMRLLYARRRKLLADALRDTFGQQISIDLTSGGMHLIVRFKGDADDVALARRAQQAGLMCQPLSERSRAGLPRAGRAPKAKSAAGLLLGFTNIASEEFARVTVRRLRDAIAGPAPATPRKTRAPGQRLSPDEKTR